MKSEVIVVTKRERLIELLKNDNCPSPFICDANCKYINSENCLAERTADYLLANGVHITACATCDYIKYTKEKGMLIELMGKPLKYCPECGEKLE